MRRAWIALLALLFAVAAGSPAATAAVRVRIDPPAALLDQAVRIRVDGLRAGTVVTIRATTVDAREREWRSSAEFRADRAGSVDVARSAALSGTYRGRDAMGLFWSMRLVGLRGSQDEVGLRPPDGPTAVIVAVLRNGRGLAAAPLVRTMQSSDVHVEDESLAQNGFVGRFLDPQPIEPQPGILYLGGSEGGLPDYPAAKLLATRGYPTLELAYFGVPGLPQELRNIPLEYFATALRWLGSRPDVDPARLVVLGASRGGEASLLVGATFPQLVHGVVAYVPSSLVQGSCCVGALGAGWTLGGLPVAYNGEPGVSDADVEIPVERIAGPVLAIGSGFDQVWPSGLYVQQIVSRARTHDRQDVIGLDYLTAGHAIGIGVPNFPLQRVGTNSGRPIYFGGSQPADARARAASWPKVLDLLGHLP